LALSTEFVEEMQWQLAHDHHDDAEVRKDNAKRVLTTKSSQRKTGRHLGRCSSTFFVTVHP